MLAGGEIMLAGGEIMLVGGEMNLAKIRSLGKIFAVRFLNFETLFPFYFHSIPIIVLCPKLLQNHDFT